MVSSSSAASPQSLLRRGYYKMLHETLGTVVAVATSEPLIALTFDDGPHPDDTPRLLDVLARHNARATFFMVGEAAQRHPDTRAPGGRRRACHRQPHLGSSLPAAAFRTPTPSTDPGLRQGLAPLRNASVPTTIRPSNDGLAPGCPPVGLSGHRLGCGWLRLAGPRRPLDERPHPQPHSPRQHRRPPRHALSHPGSPATPAGTTVRGGRYRPGPRVDRVFASSPSPNCSPGDGLSTACGSETATLIC